MKNMTKAIVIGGFMVLAQTALANDRVAANTASAFPGAAEDGFIQLSAKTTYADRHLDKATRLSQTAQESGIKAN